MHDTSVFLLLQIYIFSHSTLSPGVRSVTVGSSVCGEYYKTLQLPIVVWTVNVKTVDGGSFCYRHSLACISKHEIYGGEK